ncbi:hypothetical protein GBAR_LOCUS16231 [Geodia barretti]|nr:hypothetical protein GBAR_LOCUS16231 [Geodia barretti]
MEGQRVKQQLERELARAEETIRRNQQTIQKETEPARKDRELAEALEKLRHKEEQLQSSEALVADFQHCLQIKDSEFETLKRKTSSKADGADSATPTVMPQSTPSPMRSRKLTVQCRTKETAPQRMLRGSATSDGRFAYFTPHESRSMYRYEWRTGKWDEVVSSCPAHDSGIVFGDNELISVGGGALFPTSKVLSLKGKGWEDKYPPMNTARYSPAVVATPEGNYMYIFVIGGYTGNGRSTTAVELLQVKTRKWYRLVNLPQPLTAPSAVVCGDTLHVIGYEAQGYSCSLRALPPSDQPIPPQLISWTPLPPLPVTHSTAGTLGGQLLLVGGRKASSPTNSIHQLVDGEWVEIASMIGEREKCLVVNISPFKMLIVSGVKAWNNVEECVVTM